MKEVWKDICGYEGYYRVSNTGFIKRLAIGKVKNERLLKSTSMKHGYQYVTLSMEGLTGRFLVHRLVACAFKKNQLNKPTVNHLDGNPRNNHIKNLKWATNKEQTHHAIKIGLMNNRAAYYTTLTWTTVGIIREALAAGHRGDFIAKYFNISKSSVSAINVNKNWTI